MSSISGISSSTDGLAQFLQKIRSGQKTSGTAQVGGSPPPGPPPSDEQREEKFADALESQGFESTTIAELQTKIDEAVKSVTENSDGETENRNAIHSAIDGVLKEAGVDLEQFQQDMGVPPENGEAPSSMTSQFAQFLENSGVDPQAFINSLMSSLQSSDASNVDFASLFSTATVGSSVDELA